MLDFASELDNLINEIEDQDLGVMAIVGRLIEARDYHAANSVVLLDEFCVMDGHQRLKAAGWATCDGIANGVFPYCPECLAVLEPYEQVTWATL